MSVIRQITGKVNGVPKVAVGVLVGVMVFGLFMVGFDQGEIFGMTVPENGSTESPGTNWAHEFYHDMRHSAGFPCH